MRIRAAVLIMIATTALTGCIASGHVAFKRDGYLGRVIGTGNYRAAYASLPGTPEAAARDSFLYWSARMAVAQGYRYFVVERQEIHVDDPNSTVFRNGRMNGTQNAPGVANPTPPESPFTGGTQEVISGLGRPSSREPPARRGIPATRGLIYRINAVVTAMNHPSEGTRPFDAEEILARTSPRG